MSEPRLMKNKVGVVHEECSHCDACGCAPVTPLQDAAERERDELAFRLLRYRERLVETLGSTELRELLWDAATALRVDVPKVGADEIERAVRAALHEHYGLSSYVPHVLERRIMERLRPLLEGKQV